MYVVTELWENSSKNRMSKTYHDFQSDFLTWHAHFFAECRDNEVSRLFTYHFYSEIKQPTTPDKNSWEGWNQTPWFQQHLNRSNL